MSMLDLIFTFAVIAAAFALYHKIRATRSLKRLVKFFDEPRSGESKPTAPREKISDRTDSEDQKMC
jgi:hypothetical protein